MTNAPDALLPPSWKICYTAHLDARLPGLIDSNLLPLRPVVSEWLKAQYPAGIFAHQALAIDKVLSGTNACLATATASGKSLAFMTAGLERLVSEPGSRILALYPQKALGNEQQTRWSKALSDLGLPEAGRIDGSINTALRSSILRTSRVVVMTPDVLHAWLLSNITDKDVRTFLKELTLVVVDEVHTYTGVFGSNAAYLFRRLQHAVAAVGGKVQFFAASATIREPQRHLELLFGLPFELIGPEHDSSPRHPLDVYLTEPPRTIDFLSEVTTYLHYLVEKTKHKFIVFVDSRKQTEQIASILSRLSAPAGDETSDDGQTAADPLLSAAVLPYRAGYEEVDRQTIERRLREGNLRGVISTSALELGIDIQHLDLAVLLGVPRSSTSLQQRIGRVGRGGPGSVVVINSGEIFDEAVFRNPATLLHRPPAEGALYLENLRVQYIHALCLARPGGEHDQLVPTEASEATMSTAVEWPTGFLALCEQERTGQVASELQAMKSECGDDPNHVFPLRDVESQFKVELRNGPLRENKGSLSFGQVLREAYPGAVYYYATRPLRVTHVSLRDRTISVRPEKRYTTKPSKLPVQVFPNFGAGNVFRGLNRGDMRVVECNLQVREALVGFKERRGGKEHPVNYPLSILGTGLTYNSARFARNYFTTGSVIAHPSFDKGVGELDVYAELFYEALLMTAPYERQDLGFACDKVRVDDGIGARDSRFLAIFDQTYGSLRLSGRLLEPAILAKVAKGAFELASGDDSGRVTQVVIDIAHAVAATSESDATGIQFASGLIGGVTERAQIIMPGSKGINVTNGNTEFLVEKVLIHPKIGLAYRGRHDGSVSAPGQFENIPAEALVPFAGESVMGWYDYESGDVQAIG